MPWNNDAISAGASGAIVISLVPHSPILEIRNSELEIGELFVVASYGKIIPKAILNFPKHGTLNIHPSLLPKYRGPAPIHAAILNGDDKTGVTLMLMDEKVDHGGIVGNTELRIQNIENYKSLHDRLAALGAELLIDTLPDYIAGKIKSIPQDDSQATFTKMITKEDGRIDWNKSAEEVDRKVRAFSEWPVAWSIFVGNRMMKIYETQVLDLSVAGKPGELEIADGALLAHTGTGVLEIKKIQAPGGRILSGKEFANGYLKSGRGTFVPFSDSSAAEVPRK